jgi:hypothetical protein
MPGALHLLKAGDVALAVATIEKEVAAGDAVSVVLLHDTDAPAVPAGVAVRRVPGDMSYEELLEAMFAADRVIAW